jgi:hypothetical protein
MKSSTLTLSLALALSIGSTMLGACTAAMDRGEVDQSGASALANPDEDEDLKWVKEHGFESTLFMATCVSVGEDGSTIDTAPLPVGGGRHLECTSYAAVSKASTGASSVDGEHWCVLGAVDSSRTGGDPRLHVQITSTPDSGPWSVIATSDQPIEIDMVHSNFGDAWPVWIIAAYKTLDLQPEQEGKSCEELFGL